MFGLCDLVFNWSLKQILQPNTVDGIRYAVGHAGYEWNHTENTLIRPAHIRIYNMILTQSVASAHKYCLLASRLSGYELSPPNSRAIDIFLGSGWTKD